MDPRRFLKRVAKHLGLMKNESESTKVSAPSNFEHRVHVGLDRYSGDFVGLPPQWKRVVGTTPNHVLSPELPRAVLRRNIARKYSELNYDNALDHVLSRTSTNDYAKLAASLETPGSRVSVADNQDLIIERLKRELRDYKARNSRDFEECAEDPFLSLEPNSSTSSPRTSPTKRSPVESGNIKNGASSTSFSVPNGLQSKEKKVVMKKSESEV